jgi:hypothetical protein
VRTGDCSIITGVYRVLCGCAVESEIRRGDLAPSCPKCRQDTAWALRPRPDGIGAATLAPLGDPSGTPGAPPARIARRRRRQRIAKQIAVECTGRDGALAVGHTVDLSASGALIEGAVENLTIPKAFAHLTPLATQVLSAFASGVEIRFRSDGVKVSGDVIRCTATAQRVRFACQFREDLDVASWRRLDLGPRGDRSRLGDL